MSATLVRQADPRDADAIWPLARDFATSFRPRHDDFGRTFGLLLNQPSALVLVAELDETIVGYLLAHQHGAFFANGPVAWVEEVMVAEERRRLGVGQALMSAAENWARRIGAAYLSLASRRAESFYLRLGYQNSATFFKKNLT